MKHKLLLDSLKIRKGVDAYDQASLRDTFMKVFKGDTNISQIKVLASVKNYLHFKKDHPELNTFFDRNGKEVTVPIDVKHINRLIAKIAAITDIPNSEEGYCAGFSPLWGYGRWLANQANHQQGTGNDVYWYYATVLTLINVPPDKLTHQEKADIEELLSAIEGMQYPEGVFYVPQSSLDITLGTEGYQIKLITEQTKPTKLEKNIIYVQDNNGKLSYSLIDLQGAIVSDIPIEHDEIKIPSPTQDSLAPFKEEIFKVVSEAGYIPNKLQKEFGIAGLWTEEQVLELFKKINPASNKLININSHNHASFLLIKDGTYTFFDPNSADGEVSFTRLEELINKIFSINLLDGNKPSPIEVNIFGFDKKASYPNASDIFEEMKPESRVPSGYAKDMNGLIISARAGSIEGVNYYLETASKDYIDHHMKNNFTALMIAASYGRLAIVEKLIEAKAKLDLANDIGNTALMLAAGYGHVEVVGKLIEAKAKLDLANNSGKTALMLAAENGHVEAVGKLIEAKAKLDIANDSGNTALMLAAGYGHVEVVGKLIEAKAKLDLANNSGKTALMLAAENGHVEVVGKLIEAKAKLDIANDSGNTALMLAAGYGHVEVVGKLIEAKAKLDLANNSGKTALMVAAENGHVEVVGKLIEAKAKLDIANDSGNTALMLAAGYGHVEVVGKLIEAKAKLDIANDSGKTALMVAAENGHVEAVGKLIEAKAKLDITNDSGNTALMVAAENGHVEAVGKLIEAKAKLDIANDSGKTALMLAAENGHVEVVEKLIDAKANIDMVNYHGFTALMLAAKNGHIEVVKKLIHAGATLDHASHLGFTALMLAKQNNHPKIADMLINISANSVVALNLLKYTLNQNEFWMGPPSYKFFNKFETKTSENKTKEVPQEIEKMRRIINKEDNPVTVLSQLQAIVKEMSESDLNKNTDKLCSLIKGLNIEELTQQEVTKIESTMKNIVGEKWAFDDQSSQLRSGK